MLANKGVHKTTVQRISYATLWCEKYKFICIGYILVYKCVYAILRQGRKWEVRQHYRQKLSFQLRKHALCIDQYVVNIQWKLAFIDQKQYIKSNFFQYLIGN